MNSLQNAGYSDGGWVGLESRALSEKSSAAGYTHGISPKIFSKCDTDGNDDVLIKIPGIHKPLRVQESALERVTSGFAVGDWVPLKEEHGRHSSVGILHSCGS
ncbi:hypothetical protein GH714_034235 [Hevea brasiliensis]|uniref:Uncharacterized protein n=1 Tax=Hevea brasiliensis TaxID=3981 RepID=A0A6A6NDJ5_HEVBR|nr:hypothetical protein GH714_034235 [Hevea brasiliensis]